MIDEQELYGLADDRVGPDVTWPAVGAVLARGTRLRRRRHAVRSAGVGTVVVGVVGVGLVAVGRDTSSEDPEIATGRQDTTSTTDMPSAPPPPRADCVEDMEAANLDPERWLEPAEVPDALRVLPSWTPDGAPITRAQGTGPVDFACPVPEVPADSALILRSLDPAGVVDARLQLSGPLRQTRSAMIERSGGEISYGSGATHDEVAFRAGTAVRVDERQTGDGLSFEWQEPDGWSWELHGDGVDEADLRAIGEALTLDSSPEGDEPVAVLGPESLPAGFEVAWQVLGRPTPASYDSITWDVVVGQGGDVSSGSECMVQTREKEGDMPMSAGGGVGTTYTTVNGHEAVWSASYSSVLLGTANSLSWEISPGVVAEVGCVDWRQPDIQALPLEDVKRFAESIEPVAADDPRIPG